jgi:hypothetical protein
MPALLAVVSGKKRTASLLGSPAVDRNHPLTTHPLCLPIAAGWSFTLAMSSRYLVQQHPISVRNRDWGYHYGITAGIYRERVVSVVSAFDVEASTIPPTLEEGQPKGVRHLCVGASVCS